MTIEKFRQADTDANRTRKFNLLRDALVGAGAAGAAASTSVAVTESSAGTIKTVMTLTNKSITMTDATTAGSHGSLKLYDFPQCNLLFLGGTCNLTITAGTGGITDTAAVVGSIGTDTVGTDNATLTTTEADLIPSTASTLTGGAGVTKGKTVTAGVVVFDGTATAKDAWLNFAVPDADSTANDTLTVSGTITLVWSNLGDV
jgi:hypothetical protein